MTGKGGTHTPLTHKGLQSVQQTLSLYPISLLSSRLHSNCSPQMPPPSRHLHLPAFLLAFLLLAATGTPAAKSTTFGLNLHHRYSRTVRWWAESRSWPVGDSWPQPGTPEYYSSLVAHDYRRLSIGSGGSDTGLTFSDGNSTVRVNKLGFLHYAEVSVGTPSVSFLVALDTGSDLFWVPCDCQSCAPTSAQNYGLNFEFSIYSPNSSLTSKKVPCNSTSCELQSACSGTSEFCPYQVAYISTDTSSSGILVEDVLYLTTEDTRQEAVEARVTLGCGQVQTGSFLDSAAPNGLFGLGMEKISVPSILANAGLTSDSFSMCFGRDGIGRISFGDKGSSDQEETPFNLNELHSPTYVVSVTGMQAGNFSFTEDFSTLFDSGTSFATLADPTYTHLSESFNSQVHDRRRSPDSQIPFEYCYLISSNQTEVPIVSLTMKGGSQFPVINPVIFISTSVEVMYCLAVVKSQNLNIIGQNFMTGLRVVFDRERLVLGWKKFDCYDIEESSTLPINPRNSSTRSPSIAMGPDSYNPEATKQRGNTKQVTMVQPSSSHPLHSKSFTPTHLLLTLFLVIILLSFFPY